MKIITKINKLIAAGFLVSMTSCSYSADFAAYVGADRLNHDVQAAHYEQLVMKDTSIPPQDKATFLWRLEAKLQQITAAEVLLGMKTKEAAAAEVAAYQEKVKKVNPNVSN